jgi:hypothetical protein
MGYRKNVDTENFKVIPMPTRRTPKKVYRKHIQPVLKRKRSPEVIGTLKNCFIDSIGKMRLFFIDSMNEDQAFRALAELEELIKHE